MTTHVFAPRLKRGREGEKHFLVHCYPEEQLRTHQQLPFFYSPASLLPSFHSFSLRKQSRFVRYLALSGVCLVSWSVRLMFGASPPPSVVQSAVRGPLLVIQGVD